jgi:exonuclease SbcC
LARPDLNAAIRADEEAGEALEGGTREEARLTGQLRQVDDWLATLHEVDEKLASLQAKYQTFGKIADVATGSNRYRVSFQRYVLGVFLDEVLEAANQRLDVMSYGRFKLQRAKDPADVRRAAGLDLEVFDTFTSTARAVGTLSGGESFLASLSLALGLADTVQEKAGGVHLETIFIDEGFGTLDPETLDLAIRALRDLQRGGRLVGIISHVAELREWIDARLEVTRTRSGSSARFVLS